MVVYGVKPVVIGKENGGISPCPNCGDRNKMSFVFHRSHFHLFWIPMFPLKLRVVGVCDACETVFEKKEMTSSMKTDYENAKLKIKKPLWQFSGLILLAILIVFMKLSHDKGKEEELVFIKSPAVNDIYYCLSDGSNYSTMRVDSISIDSVFVCPNLYEIDKRSKVYKIDKKENYAEFNYGISKLSILEMYTRGDIFNVYRD